MASATTAPRSASVRHRAGRVAVTVALAGTALIAATAAVQLGVLLVLAARRWPGGAGPSGILAVAAFAVMACGFVAAPYVPALRRVQPTTWLLLGLALTALPRLAAALLIDAPLSVDGAAYQQMALDVLAGQCCFADRSSGLPLALAPLYAALGAVPAAHELLNLAAGVAGGWLLYAIVRDEWGQRPAASALLAYALVPSLVLFTPVLLTEPLFTTLVLAALRALQLAPRVRHAWPAAAAAGALIGAAQYVRPLASLLLFAALAMLAMGFASWRRAGMAAGALLVAFGMTVSPIVAHNLGAHSALSIDSSSFAGSSLYIGTTQSTDGRTSPWLARAIRTLPGADQWQRSELAGAIAMRRIARHPFGFARLAARKFPIMWSNDEEGARFALSRAELRRPLGATLLLASQLAYAALAVLATIGLWLGRRRPSALVVGAAVLLVGAIGLHTFVEVKPRYHFWLIPLFVLMAAPTVQSGLDRLRLGRSVRGGS